MWNELWHLHCNMSHVYLQTLLTIEKRMAEHILFCTTCTNILVCADRRMWRDIYRYNRILAQISPICEWYVKQFKAIFFSMEVYFRIQGAAVPVGDRICKTSKASPNFFEFLLHFHSLYPIFVSGVITCVRKTICWDKPCNIQLCITK